MANLTLLRQKASLARASQQVRILDGATECPTFHDTVESTGLSPLSAGQVEVLQVNVGKVCNQTCGHCHVDAGPDRREAMSPETAAACLRALDSAGIGVLDITGGAPEMNPQFEALVTGARRLGRRVIDRCNLTILRAPGYTHLPEFLAAHEVEIVASLPCYLEENCDAQRGDGVFQRSITALKALNRLGYGVDERLSLTLVYNPLGPSLPPPQEQLEDEYRAALRERYGVEFTRLYTITNLPISRFLDDLLRTNQFERYLRALVDNFNPATVGHLMCRTMISVDWRGNLYDCDFNQMLELPVADGRPRTIHEFSAAALAGRPIRTGRHCYGCTAGGGSSCQGATVAST